MFDKVLIIALDEHWAGISRLPSGLNRAGFKVFALCPQKSYLRHTQFLTKSIVYPTFTYSRSKLIYLWIVFSIYYFKPHLLIPGDEDSILALQNLSRLFEKISFFKKISKLIRKSITLKEFDSIILSKGEFQKKCEEWGIRVPESFEVKNFDEAFLAASKLGFPLVLKHDTGYGGSGVFICQDLTDLRAHFLNDPSFSLIADFKKKLRTKLFISVFNMDKKITLQQYIDGQVGLAPFCALEGQVFATNSMLKLRTHPGRTGPTSVAHGIENTDVNNFVKIIADKLNYTGFGSLDFILDKKGKNAFVIEINPRPVPTCHFTEDVVANDLCDLFYKGINFKPRVLKPFRSYTVAIFPNEQKRDPQSVFLKEAYHDIPFNDPHLLRALEAK